jgi:hypothetical protein
MRSILPEGYDTRLAILQPTLPRRTGNLELESERISSCWGSLEAGEANS